MQSNQDPQHLYREAQHHRQRAEFWGRQVAVQLRQLAAQHVRLQASMAALHQTRREFWRRCGWVEDHQRCALTNLLVRLTVPPA